MPLVTLSLLRPPTLLCLVCIKRVCSNYSLYLGHLFPEAALFTASCNHERMCDYSCLLIRLCGSKLVLSFQGRALALLLAVISSFSAGEAHQYSPQRCENEPSVKISQLFGLRQLRMEKNGKSQHYK